MPDPLLESDPPWVGPFRLQARLGEGGMGQVFLGHDFDGTPAAVKLLRSTLTRDPALLRRFAREVDVVQQIGGHHIARLLDADLDTDPPWLATEFVDGPSLRAYVKKRGPFTLAQLQALALGLLDALDDIHAAGVVHRDLTPSNVLLAAEGPKVLDFGIALPTAGTVLTRTGMVVGTAFWMAPEQATGDPLSTATDVFAWACVVTFAALGRSPFGEGRPEEVLDRIVRRDPDLGELPAALRPAIVASLHKDPAKRPPIDALRADAEWWGSTPPNP